LEKHRRLQQEKQNVKCAPKVVINQSQEQQHVWIVHWEDTNHKKKKSLASIAIKICTRTLPNKRRANSAQQASTLLAKVLHCVNRVWEASLALAVNRAQPVGIDLPATVF
jgi:hypothetical protein